MTLSNVKPELLPNQVYCRLEVEVDFQTGIRGFVGIRFYSKEGNDMRIVLPLASVSNRIIELQRSDAQRRVWSELDRAFLLWLAPELKRIPYHLQNLNVLKITEDEFERWRQRWKDYRARFIDRRTQEFIVPYGCDGSCRQWVDLEPMEGNAIKIGLKIEFSDGTVRCPHEILKNLGLGGDSSLHRQLGDWKPAVSWAQMNKYFSRKSPSLPADKVVDYIVELLEGHLEIIRPGKLVEVREGASHDAIILAETSPQGLKISAKWSGQPLAFDAPNCPSGTSIRESNGHFVIERKGESEASGERRRNLLKALQAGNRGSLDEKGVFCLRNSMDNARMLREIWRQAESASEQKNIFRVAPQLRGLLSDECVEIRPEISLRERGNFVETEIAWRDESGEIFASHQAILQAVAVKSSLLQLKDGGWLALDNARMQEAVSRLKAKGVPDYSIMTAGDAKRAVADFSDERIIGIADDSRKIFARLSAMEIPEIPKLPEKLASILRPYQQIGYEFLADRVLCNAGCILADDMGLGKTLEVIALLVARKEQAKESAANFKVLVVCPATLMSNWQEQISRFAGDMLSCVSMAGVSALRRRKLLDQNCDVLITHYGLVRSDIELLQEREFDLLILDEAQAIKNPISQISMAVKSLKGRGRIAMTGTPLENRLNDVWSVMEFLNSGLLGDLETFEMRYNDDALPQLKRRIAPFILRRTKEQVAKELPSKTVEVLKVTMTEEQRKLYDEVVAESKLGFNKSTHFEILACLTRLRQICDHPDLYLKTASELGSGKMAVLLERLVELVQAGHSVLVFSQFTTMLDKIGAELAAENIRFWSITGDTPIAQRQKLVNEFNDAPEAGVFLLSLKTGGTGLTLTRADYAFLCDPWWNPAVENQAIDRMHRIGQTKPVFAYRLIAENSIEERVVELLKAKQNLFDAVMGEADEDSLPARLSQQDLMALIG